MDKIYVFGHRNPDTDSVAGAIALAYLKRKLGYNCVPVVLSSINLESSYALDYFKVPEPMFLNDIKLKVKEMDYAKGYMVLGNNSIKDAFDLMEQMSISKVPVVDKKHMIIGIIGMRDIARYALKLGDSMVVASFHNIVKALDGVEVVKASGRISGKIIIADNLGDLTQFKGNIMITKTWDEVVNDGIKGGIKLVIISGDECLDDMKINLARQYRVNVIRTLNHLNDIINLLKYARDVQEIISDEEVHVVCEDANLSDFIRDAGRTKYTYYPVVNKDNQVLGMIKSATCGFYNKKKVILVDHNSYEQSAIGLDEADIVEIIDHHNISNIGTMNPINFRNMPVGSTNTIIYLMYRENKVNIPYEMAGMMLSGILSDTLILNSPTTTKTDRDAVNALSKIAKVDYKEYGYDMITYGTRIFNKTKEEILYNDFKKYPTKEGKIGLGQVYTTDIRDIDNEKDAYIDVLNEVALKNGYSFVALFVTDIIKNGTYVYYSSYGEGILSRAFDTKIYEGYYLEGILSRKMQILPKILNEMNY